MVLQRMSWAYLVFVQVLEGKYSYVYLTTFTSDWFKISFIKVEANLWI
jgi:hypothetical protein